MPYIAVTTSKALSDEQKDELEEDHRPEDFP